MLTPEYQKLPDVPDLDPFRELGIGREAPTEAVDAAWSRLSDFDRNEAAHVAWKLLRDPAYRRLYEATGSVEATYEAGFFADRLTLEQVEVLNPRHHDLVTPYHKIANNLTGYHGAQPPVVLLTTGGYSPIHYGHLSMMETGKNAVEQSGRTVVGGYLSPSHDDYVGQKYGGEARLGAMHRNHLIQQAVDASDWLMDDPWESTYPATDINFTDVMRRLKSYLAQFLPNGPLPDIFYVSGADNAGFTDVLKYMDGGVTVSRGPASNDLPEIFRQPEVAANPNLIFVPSDDPTSEFSSSKVRTWKPLLMPKEPSRTYFGWRMNLMSEDLDVSPPIEHYIIRDDGEWAVANQFFPEGLSDRQCRAIEAFKAGVTKTVVRSFAEVEAPDVPQTVDVRFFPLDEQREVAQKLAAERPTLNLDACTNDGPGGINFSRLFETCDGQFRPYDLIARPGFPSVGDQIDQIDPGEYLFLDDDIASGSTLNHLMGLLPEDIKVTAIRTLFNESRRLHPHYNTHNVSDIVDLRDFILGAHISGLVVTTPDRQAVGRAPYMLPFVSPLSRASIPLSTSLGFSRDIWRLNEALFEDLGGDLTLGQAAPETQNLMLQLGFSTTTPLAQIAEHYRQLLGSEQSRYRS